MRRHRLFAALSSTDRSRRHSLCGCFPTFDHQEWRPLILVLCRRHNQRIVLSGLDIIIEVLSVKGNTVRLGITAPADVKVMREELLVQCVAPSPVIPHVL